MQSALSLPLSKAESDVRWIRLCAFLIAALSALRIWLAADIGLTDTESYYFAWSRSLELSYYDHPPLLAWIAHFTTWGSESTLAIRAGAILGAAIFDAILVRFCASLFSVRAAFLTLIAVSLPPLFLFAAWIANPEAILAPLWLASMMAIYSLRDHDERWRPLWVGALIGVGFLAKYTAVLAVPLTLVWITIEPKARRWWKRSELYLGGIVALSIVSPVIYWNAAHGWPTVKLHLVDRMSAFDLLATLRDVRDLLLVQAAVLFPLIAAVLLIVLVAVCIRALRDPRYRFLALFSGPVLCFFLWVMARASDPEPHWTMVSYVPLTIALGAMLDERWQKMPKLAWTALSTVLVASLGVWLVFLLHWRTTWVLESIPADEYRADADPLNETLGWSAVASAVTQAARNHGPRAVVVASHNVLCGHLDAAVGREHPVYCTSPRPTQYDFIDRAVAPADAPLVFVDSERYPDDPSARFSDRTCEPGARVEISRGIRSVAVYRLYSCSPTSSSDAERLPLNVRSYSPSR